jgi:GrpB-like predicted nucleotidyltransferase (UPF0157 family)
VSAEIYGIFIFSYAFSSRRMDDLSIDDERNIPLWAYETIEIEDPDPDWMDQGIRESKELLQILSAWGVREVEHIGSTAIPDLPA